MSEIEKHPQIEQIWEAMADGASVRDIEARFGVSKSAAGRLLQKGLPAAYVKAKAGRDVLAADRLLDRLAALAVQTQEVLDLAKSTGDGVTTLKAIARLEKQIELQGRIAGQLSAASVNVNVNLGESPEFTELVAQIVQALAAHPLALSAVRDVLTCEVVLSE